ncbi:diaminobutyrate acetyltransferase [Gammaproteobacteria bacterium 45_16_T64]|nr:diaminobutyrate acetyltransferase [Gammaproteobacteria bacterium 45_16_T64]
MKDFQIELELRAPRASDGHAVSELIAQCPPLDTNSTYCNLLQCTHFSSTSVAAFKRGELVGFISGYLTPENPENLFIWQVAVGEQARGLGLATRMLKHILARPHCIEVSHMETSITKTNEASWALFEGVARKFDAEINTSIMFDKEQHFQGHHDTETLVRIGPLSQSKQSARPIAVA